LGLRLRFGLGLRFGAHRATAIGGSIGGGGEGERRLENGRIEAAGDDLVIVRVRLRVRTRVRVRVKVRVGVRVRVRVGAGWGRVELRPRVPTSWPLVRVALARASVPRAVARPRHASPREWSVAAARASTHTSSALSGRERGSSPPRWPPPNMGAAAAAAAGSRPLRDSGDDGAERAAPPPELPRARSAGELPSGGRLSAARASLSFACTCAATCSGGE